MRKSNLNRTAISLIVIGSLYGCGLEADPAAATPADKAVQRDVYHTIEDCMKDWGDPKLCIAAADAAKQQGVPVAAAAGTTSASNSSGFVEGYLLGHIMGPQYVPGSRMTYHDGVPIAPRGNNAIRASGLAKPTPGYVSSKSSFISSVRASSGGFTGGGKSGFGSTGSSFGSSSS